MTTFKTLPLFFFLVSISFVPGAYAQMNAASDPGLAFNKIQLESGTATYRQIGNYKVKGSPYVFGDALKGSVYYSNTVSKGNKFKINNYDKTIEIPTSQAGQFIIVNLQDFDSLRVTSAENSLIPADLIFINGAKIDPQIKAFLQPIYRGGYKLYKSYETTIGFASGDYVTPELREFDLNVMYFYSTPENPKELHSIKSSRSSIKKELKSRGVEPILSELDFGGNWDLNLMNVFSYLDKQS